MIQPILFALEDGEHSPVTGGATVQHPPDMDAQDRCEKVAALKRRSQIAEVLFLKKAIELGYEAKWMPGNCKNYDVILERHGMRPMFVQVKHALAQRHRCNSYEIRNGTGTNNIYSPTAYDVLAVYLWDRDEWVLYKRAELGPRSRTTYTPREKRTLTRRSRYGAHGETVDDRDPDNWELLDDVAESITAT